MKKHCAKYALQNWLHNLCVKPGGRALSNLQLVAQLAARAPQARLGQLLFGTLYFQNFRKITLGCIDRMFRSTLFGQSLGEIYQIDLYNLTAFY